MCLLCSGLPPRYSPGINSWIDAKASNLTKASILAKTSGSSKTFVNSENVTYANTNVDTDGDTDADTDANTKASNITKAIILAKTSSSSSKAFVDAEAATDAATIVKTVCSCPAGPKTEL